MTLLAEGRKIEAATSTPELFAQWREKGGIDGLWAQHEAVGAFFQSEPVAGSHTHRFQDPRGELDLTL